MEHETSLHGTTKINLNHLPEGTYVVKATDNNDNVCTVKVFVEI
jgi:hypothetical protein